MQTLCCYSYFSIVLDRGCKRPDPFETGSKLEVHVSGLAFLRDLADPLWIGSPIRYQMSSLVEVIQFGTAPLQFQRTQARVYLIQMEPNRTNLIL